MKATTGVHRGRAGVQAGNWGGFFLFLPRTHPTFDAWGSGVEGRAAPALDARQAQFQTHALPAGGLRNDGLVLSWGRDFVFDLMGEEGTVVVEVFAQVSVRLVGFLFYFNRWYKMTWLQRPPLPHCKCQRPDSVSSPGVAEFRRSWGDLAWLNPRRLCGSDNGPVPDRSRRRRFRRR